MARLVADARNLSAALTGVTLSVLVLAYTGASIATTFVVTAGMFGALALYGSTTKRSDAQNAASVPNALSG